MRFCGRIILLIFLLACSIIDKAQPFCDVRKYSLTDGLAANTIVDFKQSNDKLMWFGTWNGLSYYDGYTFKTFRDGPDDIDWLTTNRIRSIHPNSHNDIWFITYDHRPYIFTTHDIQFINVAASLRERLKTTLLVDQVYTLQNATWLVSKDHKILIRSNELVKGALKDECEIFIAGKSIYRGGKVFYIKNDSHGREWVLTTKGTYVYSPYQKPFYCNVPFFWLENIGKRVFLASKTGELAEYIGENQMKWCKIPSEIKEIREIKVYDKNTLLLATNIGLVTFDVNRGTTRMWNLQNPNNPSTEVTSIYVDTHKNIWAFTKGSGITRINLKDNTSQWMQADLPEEKATRTDLELILEDEYGVLWMIPRHGTFCYYDTKKKELVPYMLTTNNAANYPVRRINKYVISDQRILWITGYYDLVQIDFKYHTYLESKLDRGISSVRSILLDSKKRYWNGYKNGTIQILDKDKHILGYLNSAGQIQHEQTTFVNSGVYSLYEDNKHRIWIGTDKEGLYVLNTGNKLTRFMPDAKDRYALKGNKIYDVQSDKKGRLWVATFGGGLNLVDESTGKIRFINTNNTLSLPKNKFTNCRRIFLGSHDEIIIGTTDGLVSFSDKFKSPDKIRYFLSRHIENDTTSLLSDDVMSLIIRPDGCTFVATMGGGLQFAKLPTLLKDNLQLTYVRAINPEEGIIQSIIEDKNKNIWLIRESSIDKFNPVTNRMNIYGPNDFCNDAEFTEARPVKDIESDEISIGTNRGAFTFKPTTLIQSNYSPEVMFTSVHYLDGIEQPILNVNVLEIPSDKRNLTINFASLDYTRNYQMKYAYRIKEEGSKWHLLGENHSISFNRIPHGTFTIQVRSTNTHGIWSKKVKDLKVHVEATFWESIIGRIVQIIFVLFIIFWIVYFFILRNQHGMDKKINKLKTKFYSNASHQLRTPLTLIGGPIDEVLQKEPSLSESSKELLNIVRRNTAKMLDMVNQMLNYSIDGKNYIDDIIDDGNARYFMVNDSAQTTTNINENSREKENTILVVEDNKDLRTYLYNILCNDYNVILAENGYIGIEKARKYMPDFIITDITMPVLDGLTMIRMIREDSDINHLPIIILSARASEKDRNLGNELGALGYITKPFSATYLKGRVDNFIAQRKAMQQQLLSKIRILNNEENSNQQNSLNDYHPNAGIYNEDGFQYQDEKSSIQGINDKVIQKVILYLDENLSNPDLKIDHIAIEMGMSRSVLYSKIRNAVGMSPVGFVRHIRILRAEELISQTEDSFSQIAYAVGFSDPKYFTKVFKKETGMTPSEYRDSSK